MPHSWGCHSKGCTLTLDALLSRATWQTLYQNPAFDTRFFLSNPGELWLPLIQHENATYGDLIVLSDLEESKYVATHIKPLEFHKHIANSGLSWDYWRNWTTIRSWTLVHFIENSFFQTSRKPNKARHLVV